MRHACIVALLASAWALSGCETGPSELDTLRDKLDQSRDNNQELRLRVEGLEERLAQQTEQIRILQELGPKRLDYLFSVDRISLGRYTGSYRPRDGEYDSGVRVYLEPIDQYGSVIKAAGEVTVELFDLAQPEGSTRLGNFRFPVEEIRQHWASGFLTYHYNFDCPWPDNAPPAHGQITVRVTFVHYLTGKSFVSQRVVDVKLSPAVVPAE
jgi:hypothetical protein